MTSFAHTYKLTATYNVVKSEPAIQSCAQRTTNWFTITTSYTLIQPTDSTSPPMHYNCPVPLYPMNTFHPLECFSPSIPKAPFTPSPPQTPVPLASSTSDTQVLLVSELSLILSMCPLNQDHISAKRFYTHSLHDQHIIHHISPLNILSPEPQPSSFFLH